MNTAEGAKADTYDPKKVYKAGTVVATDGGEVGNFDNKEMLNWMLKKMKEPLHRALITVHLAIESARRHSSL